MFGLYQKTRRVVGAWVRSLNLAHYFNSPSPKMEIVSLLAAQNGFRRYLELCTSTTGNCYAALDREILTTAHRLMYNCPAGFDDGFAIEFRSESLDISRCLAEINRKRLRYDIILVDPWHEYDTSSRDLGVAFDLIDEGGILVVHDCLPPNAAVATPGFVPGCWCGLTYKAYLDFVCGRRDLNYQTIDTDYGCGIIHKLDSRRAEHRQNSRLWQQWQEIGDDFERAFSFFEKHKKELLNLFSPDEFYRWQHGYPNSQIKLGRHDAPLRG